MRESWDAIVKRDWFPINPPSSPYLKKKKKKRRVFYCILFHFNCFTVDFVNSRKCRNVTKCNSMGVSFIDGKEGGGECVSFV